MRGAPRRRRIAGRIAAQMFASRLPAEAAWDRVRLAWKKSTRKQYESLLKNLDEFVRLCRRADGDRAANAPISADEFAVAMNALFDMGRRGSTFQTYRAAVIYRAFLLRDENMLKWAKSEWATRLCDALAFNGGDENPEAKERGAMTEEQLRQLISLASRSEDLKMYAVGFGVAFYLLFRHNELCNLQPRDIGPRPHAPRAIKLFNQKTLNRKTKAKHKSRFVVPTSLAVSTYEELLDAAKEMDRKQPFFPGWDRDVANGIIKEAAQRFKWPTDLVWSFHSLRHGGASVGAREGLPVFELMRAGGWQSERTVTNIYTKIR